MAYRIYKQKPTQRKYCNQTLSICNGRWHVICRSLKVYIYARAVMEAHLKRPLHSSEIVIHINGNKKDDRIENLQIISRAQVYKNMVAQKEEESK